MSEKELGAELGITQFGPRRNLYTRLNAYFAATTDEAGCTRTVVPRGARSVETTGGAMSVATVSLGELKSSDTATDGETNAAVSDISNHR